MNLTKVTAGLFSGIMISMLLISSCNYHHYEVEKRSNNDSPDNITYTNYVAAVITTNCTFKGCHNSRSFNGDYTTYEGIKIHVDNGAFQNRVLNLKEMPPSWSEGPHSLDDVTLQRLQAWIDHGAIQ